MVKMTANKAFPYQGMALKAGDAFVARDKTHARQLRGAGFASDAKAVKKGKADPEQKLGDTGKGDRPKGAEKSDAELELNSKDSKAGYQTRALTSEV